MLTSVVAAIALAAVSNVAAGPINHIARGYAQDAEVLEDYTGYHVRYLALNCHDKHNTDFFDECCHPLLRTQKLSERPSQCTPSASASSSAALAEPTAATVDEDPIPDDDDCDAETATTAPAATSSAPPATKAAAPAPAPTSSAPPSKAAEPTYSEKPETTSEKPTPTPSPAPAPPSGGDVNTGGFATFFYQGGNAGACGDVHSDSDFIIAIDQDRYGDLSKKSDTCGKKIHITNTNNGKTVIAMVADACPTCKNANSLDLSTGAFNQIALPEEGMVPIDWYFVN